MTVAWTRHLTKVGIVHVVLDKLVEDRLKVLELAIVEWIDGELAGEVKIYVSMPEYA